jgi:hypothetical protein
MSLRALAGTSTRVWSSRVNHEAVERRALDAAGPPGESYPRDADPRVRGVRLDHHSLTGRCPPGGLGQEEDLVQQIHQQRLTIGRGELKHTLARLAGPPSLIH